MNVGSSKDGVAAIVLTGTIVPNATFVSHSNVEARRLEYLEAILFFKEFGPVYFLENSTYSLMADPDFIEIEGVYLRKFPPSKYFDLGKGYQEFEMLKSWLESEAILPTYFFKVTGRFKIDNFKNIYRECLYGKVNLMVIDQYPRQSSAHTRLFFSNTSFYKEKLSDFYLSCNDEQGAWAERVLYKALFGSGFDVRFFRNEPKFVGIDGSTGVIIRFQPFKYVVKLIMRRLNLLVSRKYIYFR